MKLAITSDGTPKGTRVINKDTGKELDRVTHIELDITPEQCCASVTILAEDVELSGEFEVFKTLEGE